MALIMLRQRTLWILTISCVAVSLYLLGAIISSPQDIQAVFNNLTDIKQWVGDSASVKPTIDLVEYYGLNISNPDSTFQLLSPLSSKQLKSISDPKKLDGEGTDRSPEHNPWFDDKFEPETKAPLVRQQEREKRPGLPAVLGGSGAGGRPKRIKAALISLVRNEELDGILQSMSQLEDKFNSKFNYPWIFFNDKEFTPEFKQMTQAATKSKCKYVLIDPQDWLEPAWIDTDKALELNNQMSEEQNVQYAAMASYHRMCRWNSGPFFTNRALAGYDYYWRVEPKVNYYCSIDYDVFAYMADNDKDYGFTISVYDSPQTIKTLWPTTVAFFQEHPEYLHPNNSRQWLLQDARKDHNDDTGGYSTCHFWSNFEIGRLDFFRSKQYQEYFEYLDKKGGFFYERWGDAPVHSVALALLTDKSRIHWFKDIGYNHVGYSNCHSSSKCRGCVAGRFTHWTELNSENCIKEWFKVAGDG